MSRFFTKELIINENEQYDNLLEGRGVRKIQHYPTPTRVPYEKLLFDSIATYNHVWRWGDRYYKLSVNFYGDPQYWWVIASFNNTVIGPCAFKSLA